YLSTCCESIERNILESGLIKIATEFYEGIFSWDKVPGEDNTPLLFHLKHMFKLKGQGPYYIKKEDNVENPTITVSWPSAPLIILKLDKARHKVLITSKVDGQITELEYEVHEEDHKRVVSKRIPSKESAIGIVNDAEKKIEQLIYGFVYRLALSGPEGSKEFSYYYEILSRDERFMKMVQEIYQNRQVFERGYKRLTNSR
ncbi:MAG: hypothetical protein WBE68_25815, partial [Candidatus Nitrosopolaris sp.]